VKFFSITTVLILSFSLHLAKTLENLKLDHNQLALFPPEHSSWKRLRVLNLWSNHIEQFPHFFIGDSLLELDVSVWNRNLLSTFLIFFLDQFYAILAGGVWIHGEASYFGLWRDSFFFISFFELEIES